MAAQRTDFAMFEGDSKTITVTVRDEAAAVVDLSGFTIRWGLSPLVEGGFNPAATLSKDSETTGGIEITSAVGGVFVVTLDPDDTEALAGKYYHEAEVTDAAGNIATVLTGRITITPVLLRAS